MFRAFITERPVKSYAYKGGVKMKRVSKAELQQADSLIQRAAEIIVEACKIIGAETGEDRGKPLNHLTYNLIKLKETYWIVARCISSMTPFDDPVYKWRITGGTGYGELYKEWGDLGSLPKSEHRYIMERHIGRKLGPKEHIHHINRIKDDNRIENLQIVSPSEHARMGKKKIAA